MNSRYKLIYILVFFLIISFWIFLQLYYNPHVKYTTIGDSQRDKAIVYNLLNGNFFSNPTYLGQHSYYPILFHIIILVIYRISGISIDAIFASYYYIFNLICLFMICVGVMQIFKNLAISIIAIVSIMFLFPWTRMHIGSVHPLMLGLGTLSISLMLFNNALKNNKWPKWILSGVGIAIVIHTQPAATLVISATYGLYQLITRKKWKYFFLMVFTAFTLTSFYIIPIVSDFIFQKIQNHIDVELGVFSTFQSALDYLLYGRGLSRWIINIFVYIGLTVFLIRRKSIDLVIVVMFLFTIIYTWLSLFSLWKMIPPVIPVLALNDFLVIHYFSASFMFAYGVNFILLKISNMIPKYSEFIYLIIFTFVIGISLFNYIPSYIELLQSGKMSYINENKFLLSNYKEEEWRQTVNWIRKNTSIYDVILAPMIRSYAYIQGHTGRKVVVSEDQQSYHPFLNYDERLNAMQKMYATPDIKIFHNLASHYQVKYVIVSSADEEFNPPGIPKFTQNSFFIPTFSTRTIDIYKLDWNDKKLN